MALARILLAQQRPTRALERLEPLVARATVGHRWGDVMEMRLLQALAYQQLHQEPEALQVLTEAVRLAEPEGYIRRFVDEGPTMAGLLAALRRQQGRRGQQPFSAYLERVLAAFPTPPAPAPELTEERLSGRAVLSPHLHSVPLPELLSQREMEVLALLAQGDANLEIAQRLMITVTTVKRHVSNIFAKLAATNRVQAVSRARELGLLDQERFLSETRDSEG
jgi:LuxR family transcriptional regulator, maltose regulon positive regulatory protein